jgi:hypothetical protein
MLQFARGMTRSSLYEMQKCLLGLISFLKINFRTVAPILKDARYFGKVPAGRYLSASRARSRGPEGFGDDASERIQGRCSVSFWHLYTLCVYVWHHIETWVRK